MPVQASPAPSDPEEQAAFTLLGAVVISTGKSSMKLRAYFSHSLPYSRLPGAPSL